MNAHKLCYIEGRLAYFTTQELADQWGDDWDDAPYEHNAGTPYTDWQSERAVQYPRWNILTLAFDSPLETPAEIYGPNSPYSVQQINNRETAWLIDPAYGVRPRIQTPVVWAGISPFEFQDLIHERGGEVYWPAKRLAGEIEYV